VKYVVREVLKCVLLREGHLRTWAQRCSQTSGERTSTRTSPYINNSIFTSSLLYYFIEKKYFHGNVGTYKIGELPGHNALRFFCWGRSLKIHIEIKRELFTYIIYTLIELSVKLPSDSPPIPSFSGIHKSKEILLHLDMKCWNSAFNAQGSRVIIVVVHVGAVKIHVEQCRRSGNRKHRMKLSLPPKSVEKLV